MFVSKFSYVVRVLCGAALILVITGCAHPINIAPDLKSIRKNEASEKSVNKVTYFFNEDIDIEVITSAGGGDKVRYKPYKDLDVGIYKTFSDIFKQTKLVKNSEMAKDTDADYLAAISITTDSSSDSAFTWPPTTFVVNLYAEFKNVKSGEKTQIRSTGEGRADFYEMKGEFNLSAKRASEDLLKKFSSAVLNSGVATNKDSLNTKK